DEALVKAPISPASAVALIRRVAILGGARLHLSAGGNVAFISLAQEQLALLDSLLREQRLSGMMLRGTGPLWLGRIDRPKIAQAVKQALDADSRFPSLDE